MSKVDFFVTHSISSVLRDIPFSWGTLAINISSEDYFWPLPSIKSIRKIIFRPFLLNISGHVIFKESGFSRKILEFWGIYRYSWGTLVKNILLGDNFYPFPSINTSKTVMFWAFLAKYQLNYSSNFKNQLFHQKGGCFRGYIVISG